MKSTRGFKEIEEEKRKFDKDLENIERKVSSRIDRDDVSSKYKDDDQKSGYDLIEQCKTYSEFIVYMLYVELDLELAESTLMSKMERRKEFVNNM